MGGCFAKPPDRAVAVHLTEDETTNAHQAKGADALSPNEVPSEKLAVSVSQQRRRLSLSQSAEARPVDGDETRGHTEFEGELAAPVYQTQVETSTLQPESPDGLSSPAVLSDGRRRRLSVSGMISATEDSFDNKKQHVEGEALELLSSLGVSYACKKGLKPESPNQDDFLIYRSDAAALYGVFDGHGPFGHDVSNYVQKHFPKLVTKSPHFHTDTKLALRDAFLQVHRNLEEAAPASNFDCSLSGTTATLVVHRYASKKLYVAHVGDSRAVMSQRNTDGKGPRALDLTGDHKPNNDAEKRRIVAAGGQVKRLDGDIPYRVFLKGRLYPGLAMSRAIGDSVGTQAGVIAEPDVLEYDINEELDVFLILASDGIWEFIESQEAVEIVDTFGPEKVQMAADAITREAWNRWIEEEVNVVDDITIEIIYMKPPKPLRQLLEGGRTGSTLSVS